MIRMGVGITTCGGLYDLWRVFCGWGSNLQKDRSMRGLPYLASLCWTCLWLHMYVLCSAPIPGVLGDWREGLWSSTDILWFLLFCFIDPVGVLCSYLAPFYHCIICILLLLRPITSFFSDGSSMNELIPLRNKT